MGGDVYPLDSWEGQASAAASMSMQAIIAETYLSGREFWKENRARCIAEGGDLYEHVSHLFHCPTLFEAHQVFTMIA